MDRHLLGDAVRFEGDWQSVPYFHGFSPTLTRYELRQALNYAYGFLVKDSSL